MTMKKQKPWSFLELAIGQGPEFAASVANNTLAQSCGAVSTVESSIAGMMTASKEHNKANKQFRLECMRENITVTINNKSFPAEVGYEMMDGEITDINTLSLFVDGVSWDQHYLIESLKDDIVEDITDILKGKANEES